MKLIRLLLRTSWLRVTLAAISGLLSGLCSAGLIALINLTLSGPNISLLILAAVFGGLCLILLVATTFSQVLLAQLAQQVIYDLRMFLNRQILDCPLRHLEEIGASPLLAALTEDVEVISNASSSISGLFVNTALLVACLIYLGYLSVPVFLFVFVLMLLGIWSHEVLVTRARRFLRLARGRQDELFQQFRTTTEGTKELKLHSRRQQAFLKDLHKTATASQRHRIAALTIFAIAASWGLLLFFIAIGLLIFGSPQLALADASVLSGYALTIIFMITPLRGILTTLPDLSRANIALEKIESLGRALGVEVIARQVIPQCSTLTPWHCLELDQVTHDYRGEAEDSRFILGPLNLSFRAGEVVFIVGGNGSGKSTLVKLLTGLYIPKSGELRVDGLPITHENRDWYRQQFSVVFSDFYLFEQLLGLNQPDLDAQAQTYLVQLQLEQKVQVREGVLSTTALSQGQRKRLALLTAYLEDRPVYVFDEWAADQDPVFKNIFYTQLLPELKHKGKTVLVISHDDQYFTAADRLIKLSEGQVVYDKYR